MSEDEDRATLPPFLLRLKALEMACASDAEGGHPAVLHAAHAYEHYIRTGENLCGSEDDDEEVGLAQARVAGNG